MKSPLLGDDQEALAAAFERSVLTYTDNAVYTEARGLNGATSIPTPTGTSSVPTPMGTSSIPTPTGTTSMPTPMPTTNGIIIRRALQSQENSESEDCSVYIFVAGKSLGTVEDTNAVLNDVTVKILNF